jgi:hypothetical protein
MKLIEFEWTTEETTKKKRWFNYTDDAVSEPTCETDARQIDMKFDKLD